MTPRLWLRLHSHEAKLKKAPLGGFDRALSTSSEIQLVRGSDSIRDVSTGAGYSDRFGSTTFRG